MDLLVCTFYKSVEIDWNSKGKFAKSVGMYYESDSTDLHVTFLSWSLDKYFVWKEVHLQFFLLEKHNNCWAENLSDQN